MKTTTTTTHGTQIITKVDGGEAKVTAEVRVNHFSWEIHDHKTRTSKTRLFWTEKWDGSMLSKEFVLGERPEITVRGDYPEIDKAWDRYNKQNLRIVREAIVKALNEMVGYRYEVKGSDVRYSRNAGCSMCPCSPGFILSDNVKYALRDACGADGGIADVDVTLRFHAAA